jgi:hypothetical protein
MTETTRTITPRQAKRIIEVELKRQGLPFAKLTARTVGFSDLARGSTVFVKIHGWKPHVAWDTLKRLAHEHGFRIEAD